MIEQLQASLHRLREKKPLVLCLTNHVSVEFVANCLLAVGALPLMSESMDELSDLMAISQSLLINIGTLDAAFMSKAYQAATIARAMDLPLILDPVGVGASQFRTHFAQSLLPFASIIRGNASEIMALAGDHAESRGVDSTQSVSSAQIAAQSLADKQVIMVSGEVDYLCHKQQQYQIPFGSSIMPKITGMGCSLTASIAAFAATDGDLLQATLMAGCFFALCGQVVAQQCSTPGTFRQLFIDQLFQPDWNRIKKVAGE